MKMANVWLTSLMEIGTLTLLMLLCVYTGVFNNVKTEDGFEHYGEKPSKISPFKDIVPMPFNTIINFGYIFVGLIWLKRAQSMEASDLFRKREVHMLCHFSWMSVMYGLIQLARIITQQKFWAIMDQWFTFPFFVYAAIWGSDLWKYPNNTRGIILLVSSLASYTAALFDPFGFELALALHILSAVFVSMQMLRTQFGYGMLYAQVMAYTSCVLFVVLKLLDLPLAEVHPFFTVISGHFLSKIADIGQIHYSILFMINYIKGRPSKKTK